MTGMDTDTIASVGPCAAYNVLASFRKITSVATLEAKSKAIDDILKVEGLTAALQSIRIDRCHTVRLGDTKPRGYVRPRHTQRGDLSIDNASGVFGADVPSKSGAGDFRQVYKSPAFTINDKSSRLRRPKLQSSSRRLSSFELFMSM